jgi:hypothetical protein
MAYPVPWPISTQSNLCLSSRGRQLAVVLHVAAAANAHDLVEARWRQVMGVGIQEVAERCGRQRLVGGLKCLRIRASSIGVPGERHPAIGVGRVRLCHDDFQHPLAHAVQTRRHIGRLLRMPDELLAGSPRKAPLCEDCETILDMHNAEDAVGLIAGDMMARPGARLSRTLPREHHLRQAWWLAQGLK